MLKAWVRFTLGALRLNLVMTVVGFGAEWGWIWCQVWLSLVPWGCSWYMGKWQWRALCWRQSVSGLKWTIWSNPRWFHVGVGRQVPQKPPRGSARGPPQLVLPPPPPYPPPDMDVAEPLSFPGQNAGPEASDLTPTRTCLLSSPLCVDLWLSGHWCKGCFQTFHSCFGVFVTFFSSFSLQMLNAACLI